MDDIFQQHLNGFLQSRKSLRVYDVVHKAIIAIDEDGSEGAGVTGKTLQLLVVHVVIYFSSYCVKMNFLRCVSLKTVELSEKLHTIFFI